eukprot:199703_1
MATDLFGASNTLNTEYTFIHVCRHVDDGWPSRIWDGKTAFTGDDDWLNTQSYWYSGFDGWGNPRVKRDGSASHANCAITDWVDNVPGFDWILSVDQMKSYRANSVDYTTYDPSCIFATQPFVVSINAGNRANWQKSSWDCTEIIAFDFELSMNEIQIVEQCLTDKHIDPPTQAPTLSPPKIMKHVFVDQAMTATNAQLHCQNTYNGNLVSIHSAEENTEIANLCVDQGQTQAACWLGMSKGMSNAESPTIWYDGTTIDYTNWYSGEPDAVQQLIIHIGIVVNLMLLDLKIVLYWISKLCCN